MRGTTQTDTTRDATTGAIAPSILLHARALSAWANSVGMTATQKEIHLYVAGMLATNAECWTSISEMARQIGKSRRGCQKAVAEGARFFTHDGHDGEDAGADARRLWRLAMPMPARDELARFMPPRRGAKLAGRKPADLRTKLASPREQGSRPPCELRSTELNTSPSVRYLGNQRVNGSSGGGGEGHHHLPDGQFESIKEQGKQQDIDAWLRGNSVPGMSRDPARQAAFDVLCSFHVTVRRVVGEVVRDSGLTEGSDDWRRLFPPDGSAVYSPSDSDVDRLLPAAEGAMANGHDFRARATRMMEGWICHQVQLAVLSHTMLRDCLRMSAFAAYLLDFPEFAQPTGDVPAGGDGREDEGEESSRSMKGKC